MKPILATLAGLILATGFALTAASAQAQVPVEASVPEAARGAG